MTQTITAMYDKQQDAQSALDRLVSAGIPKSSLKLLAGTQTTEGSSYTGASSGYDHRRDEQGFWGSLKGAFLPDEDRYSYSEGLSRGGTMLTAAVEEDKVQTALDIMDDHGSIDLDEREASWRQGGWTGYSAESGATTTGGSAVGAASATTASSSEGATRGAAQGDKDYIPVVEERLNVGKRVTDSGRVRVRSYAVEKDISEDVTLRDETVHVDRRAVDRPVTAGDEALFADKTIEATEHREQAVVSKDARVVEEVGIRKDAGQRTETVSDKVRHTEVEVEDERGNVSRTGTTGATTGTTDRKPV